MKLNWSRRELESFGEPLGDSVTQRKLGGGYVCGGGGGKGGGGGGGSPPPSSQSVSQTTIPEYARPYVENLLGQASALTDINQNPYSPYAGQRIAGFSPMQAQAFENIANQQVAGQIGEGSNLASQAGRTAMGAFGQGQQLGQAGLGYGGMGAGYGGQAAGMAGMGFGAGSRFEQMATSPGAQAAYMSPYMQNAVDYQKQQAIRDYNIARQGEQARAVGAGAYGGSRQAVAQAEGQRALQNQLAGIQATGTQKAFEDAQRQMQFGANLGLQGLQAGYQGLGMGIQGAQTGLQGVGAATQAGQYGLQGLGQGLQAASTLGQLGQTQFGQQMAISDAMQKAGALQQAQQQQGLDVQYQDFLKQQNYPYQQLAFMSDMLRGLPLSQSAQQIYTAPPSMMSQLGGLGMTGLGIYGMSGGFKAKGGVIKEKKMAKGGMAYATGGDIKMLSTKQLQELLNNPNLTPMEVEMIEQQLMLRRRMEMNPQSEEIMQRAGITDIPTGNMVPMEEMAGGGIVAFAAGSKDPVQEDPVSNKEYREFLRSTIMERLKGLQGGETDPFAESKKQEADIRTQLAERRRTAPYEALAMAGLGTMAGTSRYGLTNLGLGGIEGLKTLGRAKAEQGQMEKALMQQGVEREKAKYARDIQNLNALQTSLGQMDAREIAAINARRADAQLAESRKTRDQIAAQTSYQNAIKAEKDNLFKQNKAKYNMDYTDPELDAQAVANVNKRLSPQFKSLLFPEGMPTIEAAPAPAAAPAASGAAKKSFDVVVQGKTYTFPTKEAADTFKQRAQAATTAPTR